MASSKPKYSVGSPQEHIQTCENHDLPIDLVCEDCDEFICSTCAKTDHIGHNWVTLGAAAGQRRKGLKKFLSNIKEEKLTKVDERIAKKMAENERTCESQRKKLKKHFDEIIARLTYIRFQKDEALKGNLRKKNEHLANEKSRVDGKKKQIFEIIIYMEENNRTMSDKNLIENHRDLKHLLTDLDIDEWSSDYSGRYRGNVIDESVLGSLFGECLDLDQISATETNSFKYSEDVIFHLEALNEDECYMKKIKSENVDLVNKQGKKKETLIKPGLSVGDLCITNNGIYITDIGDKLIRCHSPSESLSTIWSADALDLVPLGICNSVDGEILVSLRDSKTDGFVLDSHSRRLVKHLTLTGNVINEYEYQQDGQTRLFTVPFSLCQNYNTDICVLNRTSEHAGEIVIVSVSGRLISVYRGQNLTGNFFPTDLVCDSTCNILVAVVSHAYNSLIHLLGPEGEFYKFLLTEKETHPMTLSLYKSALWVGTYEGLVKVFKYNGLS